MIVVKSTNISLKIKGSFILRVVFIDIANIANEMVVFLDNNYKILVNSTFGLMTF